MDLVPQGSCQDSCHNGQEQGLRPQLMAEAGHLGPLSQPVPPHHKMAFLPTMASGLCTLGTDHMPPAHPS